MQPLREYTPNLSKIGAEAAEILRVLKKTNGSTKGPTNGRDEPRKKLFKLNMRISVTELTANWFSVTKLKKKKGVPHFEQSSPNILQTSKMCQFPDVLRLVQN